MLSRLHKFWWDWTLYLLSLGSQIYVHVVGIEGELLDVIYNGLSELAAQEVLGESVWVKTTTLLCFPQWDKDVNVLMVWIYKSGLASNLMVLLIF